MDRPGNSILWILLAGLSLPACQLEIRSVNDSPIAPSLPGIDLTNLPGLIVQLGAVTKAPGAPATTSQQYDFCYAVASDSQGNIYCAGQTYGDLAELEGGGGNGDLFVMKTDVNGVVKWVTQLGATTKAPGAPANANQAWDYCMSVAVDSSGNVYCGGETYGALSEPNGGVSDAFVLKLDSNGAIVWLTQFGANTKVPGAPSTANQQADYCSGVAVDSIGNVYCAGATNGDFAETNGNGGGNDIIVIKLNSSGVAQWATQLGSTTKAPGAPATANQATDRCDSVAVDSTGNIYCAGRTSGALSEANGGTWDAFVLKIKPNGTVDWLTQLGATTKALGAPATANQSADYCYSVAVDGFGNVFCGGMTGGVLSENNLSSDAFVMKVNASGALQWITQLGSTTKAPGAVASANTGIDQCKSVATDSQGNVYCAGYTNISIQETNGGSSDAFVMKLDTTGVIQWATQLGATTKYPGAPANANQSWDACMGVSVDSAGNVYCAGETDGALSEAEGGGGNGDAFVMRLKPDGTF